MNKLKLAWFYPQELNLYGDRGNIEIIKQRCLWRSIDFEVVNVDKNSKIEEYSDCNLVFMGGGPDSKQSLIYEDLVSNKKKFLSEYYLRNGVGLFICGAYQLLGKYYELFDGSKINGLELFNIFTKSPDIREKRFVGNVIGEIADHGISSLLTKQYGFKSIIGFENHGGRTYFLENYKPFLNISTGYGNNGKTKKEGMVSKNFICSYLHGPILHLNFHIADFLISKALGVTIENLKEIDNKFELSVHKINKNLFKS